MSDDSAKGTLARWIVPSLGSVVALTAMVNALVFRRDRLFFYDGDVGRHIRVGRTILEEGAIPRVDLWSHTRAGSPFVPYEWLSEVIMAMADAAFGLAGVAALGAILFTVSVLATYRAADELGAPRLLAGLAAVLGLLLQMVHLTPRPHLFTTALAAVFLVVLLRFARTGRAWLLAPLPLLMLFWANSHGGFLIGFVLLVVFIAGALLESPEFVQGRSAVRQLSGVMFLCVMASLLNPAGLELWHHTTGYLGIDFLVDATQEYRSVDFHEGYGRIFLLALFAGPALWMSGHVRVTWLGGGLFLLFAAAALHSARNLPLFAVIVLPWLAVWLRDGFRKYSDATSRLLTVALRLDVTDRALRPGLISLLIAGFMVFILDRDHEAYRFIEDAFPVVAVRELPSPIEQGRIFNQMSWGGYLLYHRDDIPVFIDGQTDFYGPELAIEYLRTLKGRPGWSEVLQKHEIGWTLTRTGEPVNQLLALSPDWELFYRDAVATAFRRKANE